MAAAQARSLIDLQSQRRNAHTLWTEQHDLEQGELKSKKNTLSVLIQFDILPFKIRQKLNFPWRAFWGSRHPVFPVQKQLLGFHAQQHHHCTALSHRNKQQ